MNDVHAQLDEAVLVAGVGRHDASSLLVCQRSGPARLFEVEFWKAERRSWREVERFKSGEYKWMHTRSSFVLILRGVR